MNEFDAPAYFLADCHLSLMPSPARRESHQRVISFLREGVPGARSLFLVGDLFDFWFEWRHSVPSGAFPVLAALSELARQGCRVVYLGGNHDGHIGRFLSDEVGLEISRKPLNVLISGRPFHIIHGDGLAAGDIGYRMLRGLVRWPPTEAIFRLVHPDLGVWLANKLSGVSREQFSGKKIWAPDSYRDYARQVIEATGATVVMGHRHEAEIIRYGEGTYLAIGDWMRSGSYGTFDGVKAELKYFER